MKFDVEVREILSKVVTVEAESKLEAARAVERMYTNEEIVLDADNWIDTDYFVLSEGE